MKRMKQVLLISLDVLLDTRLAALAKMGMSYPDKVLMNGWKERDGDFYEQWIPEFDRNKFNEIYWHRGRDGDVHTNALLTGYINRLIADVHLLYTASINHPTAGDIAVDINIYPYTFNEVEVETLKGAVSEYLGDSIKVDVVRIANEELTPKAIRGRWVSFSIYNFDEWFSVHHESLRDNPMPSVVCIAPRLLKKPLEETPDMDPTLEVTGTLVEFLGVEWIPPSEVSIVL